MLFSATCRKVIVQLLVEPLAGARRNLECPSVAHKFDNITSAIQDCAAVRTALEVRGHAGTETGVQFAVKVI